MALARENTHEGLLEFEVSSPNGTKSTVCILNSTKGLTDQQMEEVRDVLIDSADDLDDLNDRVWFRLEQPMRIFTLSFEAASRRSQEMNGSNLISWEEFETRLPKIKSGIRGVIAKNYGCTYPEDFGPVRLFDSPSNGDLVSGYLENFGQDDCVIGLFLSWDAIARATDEILSTWGHWGVQFLEDQQDNIELTDSNIEAEAIFCMRYHFRPGGGLPTSQQEETTYTRSSMTEDRKNEVALINRIREIIRREDAIQEIIQELGGEVASLHRESRPVRQIGNDSELNTITRIQCHFQDKATRDRVVQEVMQSCEAYNVTVENQEEG